MNTDSRCPRRMNIHSAVTVATLTALAAAAPTAYGGLLSGVTYTQSVGIQIAVPPGQQQTASMSLDGTDVPAHRTAAAAADGDTMTGTLDLSDNGVMASYRIDYEARGGSGAGYLSAGPDGSGSGYGFVFTLTSPAAYTATTTATTTGSLGPTSSSYADAALYTGPYLEGKLFETGPNGTASGTLAAGVPYGLNNLIGVEGGIGQGTASYVFTLTLTAVPEPAAAGVLAVAAAGLILRRRRRRA